MDRGVETTLTATGAGLARLRRGLEFAVDFVLPPCCIGCGARVDSAGRVCARCWSDLTFIAEPYCQSCGAPFDFAIEGRHDCAACLSAPPAYGRARAALVYDEGSRRLILAFKHGDRLQAAKLFGSWVARAGAEPLAEADLIVPVPLHRWRLLRRRYNQAALIAGEVGRAAGVTHIPDLLQRQRATPSQGGLGPSARARNVAGAFRVDPRFAPRVAGSRIVLVDDVLTTGATATACAKALRRAGAAWVDVLTLARVVIGD